MAAHQRPRISAAARTTSVRKSQLSALRRSGIIPGSLYGGGDATSIQVPTKTITNYLGHHASGALLDLDLDGTTWPVLLREVDRDAITGAVIHVGFHRVGL